MLYACDPHWWNHHEGVPGFAGERWTQRQVTGADPREPEAIARWKLQAIEGEDKPGLGRGRIHYGGNSGYQAINLAFLRGARRILLLGYDYHVAERTHFFGDHPKGLNAGTNYAQFLPHFPALAADLRREGVEVINCSRATALRCWPQRTMDEIAVC